MKPVYLARVDEASDLSIDSFYEVLPDHSRVVIGRGENCTIKTPSKNKGISREQVEIVYSNSRASDALTLMSLTTQSEVWIGKKKSLFEFRVHCGEIIPIGGESYISMGLEDTGYLTYRVITSEEFQKMKGDEEQERLTDTGKWKREELEKILKG